METEVQKGRWVPPEKAKVWPGWDQERDNGTEGGILVAVSWPWYVYDGHQSAVFVCKCGNSELKVLCCYKAISNSASNRVLSCGCLQRARASKRLIALNEQRRKGTLASNGTKKCSICGEIKPTDCFGNKEQSKDKLSPHCKLCNKHMGILTRYNLTKVDYQSLLERQDGICAVVGCDNPHTDIDHCHMTGKVRELLCRDCNLALGKLKEDARRIRGLADYIEKHQQALTNAA